MKGYESMDKNDEELLSKFKEQRAKQYARQAEFVKDKYDRVIITMPKGKKNVIDNYVKKHNYKSINAYINMLIDKDMQSGIDVPF